MEKTFAAAVKSVTILCLLSVMSSCRSRNTPLIDITRLLEPHGKTTEFKSAGEQEKKDSEYAERSTQEIREEKFDSETKNIVSEEVDFEGEEFVEDSSGLPAFKDFFERRNLPIGCKVCIVDGDEVYEEPGNNPKVIEKKTNLFKTNEIVTVSQITDDNSGHRWDNSGLTLNYWTKIVSKKYRTGWVRAGNLRMVSENPNPVSIKTNWEHYGSYGAAFSPDGKYVCLKNSSTSDSSFRIFNVETGEKLIEQNVDNNRDSSKHVAFSKDSKSMFYEDGLVLKKIDVDTGNITGYGSPSSEYASVNALLLNKKGNKILYRFNSSNERLAGAVYDINQQSWKKIRSWKEVEKMKKEFQGYDLDDVDIQMRYFYFTYGDCVAVLPEKNLILCIPEFRRDNRFSGIYFFEYSSGKFLKAENPFADGGLIHVDGITVSEDGKKIVIRTEGLDSRVDNMTNYICDLDLSNLSVTVPKGIDFSEELAREEADMHYLTSENFCLTDDDGNFEARITFYEDNTFMVIDDPNGEPGYGTYSVSYDEKNQKSKVYFSLVACSYEKMEEYYERYLPCRSYGWLTRTEGDFYTVGGITYSDDNERFVRSDKEAEPYKEYYFNGENVIKYPRYDGAIRIRVDESLKMRLSPSSSGEVLECPFYGILNGEMVKMDSRNVVFAGQEFDIIASSVNKDKIDGIEDYWYLISVCEDEMDEWGESDTHLVWIFGGYTHKVMR